ncbi:sugar phosphate isomerase/epimerase family protein [Planctomycetota bacterium]
MQLGIHLGTFRRPTWQAALDAAQSHGLSCVHFNLKVLGAESMPLGIDDAVCGAISREIADRQLVMGTVSGTFNMIHPDPEKRRDGLARLDVLASAARRLGTSVITLSTGTRDPDDMWRGHPENNTPEAWRDLVASISAALDIAETHDVTLAFEPEVSNVIDSAVKARRLLDEFGSPRLKVVMDGANLFHAGELPRMHEILDEAFELLGPEIVLGHAKDLDRDGEAGQIPAGQGLLDYDHYLGLFRKVGFRGPLVLHSLAEGDVAGSVAMLREKLAKLA